MTIKEFAEKLKATIIINNTDEGYSDDNVDMQCLLQDIDELVAEAEQERTNFEKWKDELTVEKFVRLVKKYARYEYCTDCPIFRKCIPSRKKKSCDELITEWANKRCEE